MTRFLHLFALAATLFAGALAQVEEGPQDEGPRRCDAPPPSEDFLKFIKSGEAIPKSLRIRRQNLPIDVPVWFHVVRAGETTEQGYVPDSLVEEQFEHLKKEYAPHNVGFNLAGITHTLNATWFDLDKAFEWNEEKEAERREMKFRLRKGGYDTLNIYILKPTGGTTKGRCHFPEPTLTQELLIRDGCEVAWNALPGRGGPNYGEGDTAIHEVGHWFGLLHTFNPDRDNDGLGRCCDADDGPRCYCFKDPAHDDLVADTPSQCTAAYRCDNPNTDTCPEATLGEAFKGLDPIHNYMGYAYDTCTHEFTPGQATRMHEVFNSLRGGK